MTDDRDPDLEVLCELVAEQIVVEGDVIEVAEGVWAVHGQATYDGEVLLGEYESVSRARWMLGQLPTRGSGPEAGTTVDAAEDPR